MNSSSIVNLICMFRFSLFYCNLCGDELTEIIKDNARKNLLIYILHFFCVQRAKVDSIFKLSKRSFNTPT